MTNRTDREQAPTSEYGFWKPDPPHVQWDHVDGPMMVREDGTLKWLTWPERVMHRLGLWSLTYIANRPSL